MSQFRQHQQNSGKPDILGIARQLAGNDPRAALQHMADSGMTCSLPNGRVMTVKQLMDMAEGKTPQQLLSQLEIQ